MKRLTSNWISFLGLLIACVSAIFILFTLVAAWLGFESNPYLGVVAFLILPAFIGLGLILIPLGKASERRRVARLAGSAEMRHYVAKDTRREMNHGSIE